MRIISKKKLRDFWRVQGAAKKSLEAWHTRVVAADWATYHDLTRDVPSADIVGDCVVFNILHNHFRLITRVRFHTHIVYILKIMNHAEYDRVDWKTECGCFSPPPNSPKLRAKSNKEESKRRRTH